MERIAKEGCQVMYAGDIGDRIAGHIAESGGILTREDIANYRPWVGDPFNERLFTYRGYEYVTCGHTVLPQALNILECFDLAAYGPDSVTYRHLVAEAMRRAWTDNLHYMGDPRQEGVPADGMLSKAYAAALAEGIDLKRATQHVEPGDMWDFQEGGKGGAAPSSKGSVGQCGAPEHTTNMVAIDRDGNTVSMQISLATSFGSMVTVPGTGILISNGMLAFNPVPGTLNSIAPGKQPFKNPPTVLVLKDGRPFAAIAAAGGRRIMGAALHLMMNLVDFGMGIQEAIDSPRLHCERGPMFADRRISGKLLAELEAMGHHVKPVEENPHRANFARPIGALIDPITGKLSAGGDALRSTGVAGI
jgi:gamma-glutamyltranspeptidase/glutathione hydrolase